MRGLKEFGGTALTVADLRRLEVATGLDVPAALTALLVNYPLAGLTFLLGVEADDSGLGAEFRWMTADEMIDEATTTYPGISALEHRLLPVGICLEGTGDPYFVRLDDGAVLRVPHDAVRGGRLDPR
jgi:hypothetical protein